MRTDSEIRGEHRAPDRAADVRLLRESGVHKLVITDRDGNCLAYLLAWDSFSYDADTDTFVCRVDCDGQELLTLYTKGEVKAQADTNTYVVTAPNAGIAAETSYEDISAAS